MKPDLAAVSRAVVAGMTLLVLAGGPSARGLAAQDRTVGSPADRAIKADVQRALSARDLGFVPPLDVDVADGVVTLAGPVPTLWSKQEAVRRTLKAGKGRVQSVVVDVAIARAENDRALAEAVIDRVRRYDRYTVFDDIQGNVQNGIVVLTGSVTEPKKASDLTERIAKVRGVQEVDNKLVVLPVSGSDDRLRNSIAEAIYRDDIFSNYANMTDPPIHVIVNHSRVTLVGYVRSQVERMKAASLARDVYGVLNVEDKLELTGPAASR